MSISSAEVSKMKQAYDNNDTIELSKKIKTKSDFDFFFFDNQNKIYLIAILTGFSLWYLCSFQKTEKPIRILANL